MPTPRVWLGFEGPSFRCRVSPPGRSVLVSGITENYIDERSGHLRIEGGEINFSASPISANQTVFFSRDFIDPPMLDFIVKVSFTNWMVNNVTRFLNTDEFVNTADSLIVSADVYRDRAIFRKTLGNTLSIRWKVLL